MHNYLDLMWEIKNNGNLREDRTGVGTMSIFGAMMKFNLQEGFPILTTRKVPLRIAFEELMFFLNGKTQTKELEAKNINIWKGNTTKEFQEKVGLSYLEEGDMGKLYGYQIRNFGGSGHDQLVELVKGLQNDPYSRRHVMTYLNPAQASEGVLWPCHCLYQCYVNGNKLDALFYMRSSDFVYGQNINTQFYSLLTHFLAKLIGLEPGTLTFQSGDTHIYLNQLEMVEEQLTREPRPLPKLVIHKELNTLDDILTMKFEDISLIGYDPWPDFKNKPPMAV